MKILSQPQKLMVAWRTIFRNDRPRDGYRPEAAEKPGLCAGWTRKNGSTPSVAFSKNAHVVEIVYQSLTDRVASYHFALERLVIATPETQAVEVERVLNQLQNQIDRYRTLPPTWVREPSLAANH
jgi:hypothetical protein